ncbi:MAG: DoxX family protein [Spirochaetia bacterium]|nr:DoxX family protein [Spirochaetia bacterium]
MKLLTGRIAQIVFAFPMIFFGVSHFMFAQGMADMVPIPGGIYWVYFTGLCLIASAIAIISGRLVGLSAFLLGVMIFIFAFTLHLPGALKNNQMQIMMFLKDISIAAGAWVIAGTDKK